MDGHLSCFNSLAIVNKATMGVLIPLQASLVAQLVKNLPAMWETWV